MQQIRKSLNTTVIFESKRWAPSAPTIGIRIESRSFAGPYAYIASSLTFLVCTGSILSSTTVALGHYTDSINSPRGSLSCTSMASRCYEWLAAKLSTISVPCRRLSTSENKPTKVHSTRFSRPSHTALYVVTRHWSWNQTIFFTHPILCNSSSRINILIFTQLPTWLTESYWGRGITVPLVQRRS